MKFKIFGLVLIYVLIFIFVYGFWIINPFYTDWCLVNNVDPCITMYDVNINPTAQQDVFLNHVDYLSYINSKIFLPFTDMNAYPYRSGVLFIDCVPLLAMFVKFVIMSVPTLNKMTFVDIQYMGIIGVLNFVLVGLFAFGIIKKLTNCSYFNALLGSLFFVTAPILLEKYPMHCYLCADWLMFAAFLPFLYYREWSKKTVLLFWLVLGILNAGIHICYMPNTAFIIVAYMLYDYLKSKEKKNIWFYLPVFTFGAVLVCFITGGFDSDINASLMSPNSVNSFQIFSFNLNGFYNPTNAQNYFFSTVFPFLNNRFPVYHVCSWEGFAYLGAGILVALAVIIPYLLFYLPKKTYREKHLEFLSKYKIEMIVFVFLFFSSMLYSCSTDITFNERMLLSIDVSDSVDRLLNIFRCPGRIIWIDVYLIYFAVICFCIKNLKPLVATCVLGVLFMVQVVDDSAYFRTYSIFFHKKQVCESSLKNKGWDIVKQGKTCIFIDDIWRLRTFYLKDIFYWGIKNDLRFNCLITSRKAFNEDLILFDHWINPQPEDLFIFFKSQKSDIVNRTRLENCYLLDDFIVCSEDDYPELNEYKIVISRKFKGKKRIEY